MQDGREKFGGFMRQERAASRTATAATCRLLDTLLAAASAPDAARRREALA